MAMKLGEEHKQRQKRKRVLATAGEQGEEQTEHRDRSQKTKQH